MFTSIHLVIINKENCEMTIFKGGIYGIHVHCHFTSSLLKFGNLIRIILKTNISIYFKIYSVIIYSLQLFIQTSNHNVQSLLLLPALDTRKVNIKHRKCYTSIISKTLCTFKKTIKPTTKHYYAKPT